MRTNKSVLCAAAVAALSGIASAGPLTGPTVIYSDIATSDTSLVPGMGGLRFTSFDRPYRSPNGNYWIISALTSTGSTATDEVVLVGSGFAGQVVAQEGGAIGGRPDLIGLIDTQLSINDAGQFAFATNTDGDTAFDEIIVRGDFLAGTLTTAAQEGDIVNLSGGGTANLGASIQLGGILADGRVAHQSGLLNQTVGGNTGLFIAREVLQQRSVDAPSNQAGGAMETWDFFDAGDFRINADGSSWLAQGDLTGATTSDDVLVVNGAVVIQEGVALSGFTETVQTITEPHMDSAGNWMAHGSNVGGQDWMLYNGNLVAARGDAITGDTTEAWDDSIFAATFFWMASNSNGDYVVGGVTDSSDIDRNAVLVLNGSTVLLREGDAVDLDGNGLFDDNAFISVFNNYDGFLTDDGWLYLTADLRDGAGAALGQAFLAFQIPTPGAAGVLALAGLAGTRRRR